MLSAGRHGPGVQAISAGRERSLRVIAYSQPTNPVTRTSPARSRYNAPRKAPAGTSSARPPTTKPSRDSAPIARKKKPEKSGRGQPDAHRRGHDGDTDFERLTLEDEGRRESEHERHDVGRPRQADPGQGGLQRTRFRDIGGGVGRQRDRRGNHRHEPEIEHEQVRGQRIHAHVDQRWGDQDRDQDVQRRGRHAHADDDADDRGEQHQAEQIALSDRDQQKGHPESETGDVDEADHHAGHGPDDDDVHRRPAGALRRFDDVVHADPPPLVAEDEAHGDDGRRGPQCGLLRRAVPVEQREHQHHEGQREEPPVPEHLANRRDPVFRQRSDPIARGLQIRLHEGGDVVERGRHEGGENDIGIGNLQELGHQESRRPHHRRRDLAPGGRDRLERAGDLAREAGLAHERNGEDPGGCDVGHRVAGDRAEHGRGHHRDLGRAAPGAAHEGGGELREPFGAAGPNQELAHEDVHHHHDAADVHGQPEQGHLVDPQVGDQLRELHRASLQRPRHEVAEQGVENEQDQQRHQAPARGAAQRLDRERNDDHADRKGLGRAVEELLGQHRIADGQPGGARESEDREHDVEPGNPGSRRTAPGRHGEKDDRQGHGENECQSLLGEQVQAELQMQVDRERGRDRGDHGADVRHQPRHQGRRGRCRGLGSRFGYRQERCSR